MSKTKIQQLEEAIRHLQAQQDILGEATVNTALQPLRQQLQQLLQQRDGGEKRQFVTVLFADVSGFTAMSEQLDAEDVQDLLRRLWSQLDKIILDHNGHIDKHIGDGLMAIWGMVQAQEHDAVQALDAALALQQRLFQFRQEFDVSLSMRIGLNTGLVSISQISSTGENNVIGDTVNLAARLESAAPVNGVLISQETETQVRGLFNLHQEAPIKVKGKSDPVEIYSVHGRRTRSFDLRIRGLKEINTRTIGRQQEQAFLRDTYKNMLTTAKLKWVTVSGEAGVGKSRLLLEFMHWLDQRPEPIWLLKGRAWADTQQKPYGLLRDLVFQRFQIRDDVSRQEAKQKIRAGFSEILGHRLGEEAAVHIGQLIGFNFHDSPLLDGITNDPSQITGRATVLFKDYLKALCVEGPTILLLEDLHWADASSLKFFNDLFLAETPWQLCVIGIARPLFWDKMPQWGTDREESVEHHSSLDLLPLNEQAARELAAELLKRVTAPPTWLVDILVDRGAGNPYFTEELVRWCIENDLITIDQQSWQVSQEMPSVLSVPTTIQGLLQARLSQLAPPQQATLQQAAIFGQICWDKAVAYVGETTIPSEQWQQLQQRSLIYEASPSQLNDTVEYRFRHPLLANAVYQYTLKKQRQQFHKRAAEWLIENTGEGVEDWAVHIARHFERANMPTEAGHWYGRAGKQAQSSYATLLAIDHYQKALALTEGAQETSLIHDSIGWLAGLGEMLRWQAQYDEALNVYQQMIDSAEQQQQPQRTLEALLGLLHVLESQGNYAEMAGRIEQAYKIFAQLTDQQPDQAATLSFWHSWTHFRLARLDQSLQLATKSLALSREIDNTKLIARHLNLLGVIHLTRGEYDQTTVLFEEGISYYRKLGDRKSLGMMLNNLGALAIEKGDLTKATTYLQEALLITQQINNREGEFMLHSNLAQTLLDLDDVTTAESHLQQVLSTSQAQKWWGMTNIHRLAARTQLEKVLTTEHPSADTESQLLIALNSAQTALEQAQALQHKELTCAAWRTLGQVMTYLPQTSINLDEGSVEAQTCFEHSMSLAKEVGAEKELALTLKCWAEFEMIKGDQERGKQMGDDALKMFKEFGMHHMVQKMSS